MRGKLRQGRARRTADTPEILAVIMDVSMGFLSTNTRQWPTFFLLNPQDPVSSRPEAQEVSRGRRCQYATSATSAAFFGKLFGQGVLRGFSLKANCLWRL
jgi:hypothetical protein